MGKRWAIGRRDIYMQPYKGNRRILILPALVVIKIGSNFSIFLKKNLFFFPCTFHFSLFLFSHFFNLFCTSFIIFKMFNKEYSFSKDGDLASKCSDPFSHPDTTPKKGFTKSLKEILYFLKDTQNISNNPQNLKLFL